MTFEVTATGDEIAGEGVTDLPDKTVLQYNVWQLDEDSEHAKFGEVEVLSGRYAFAVDVGGWPERDFKVRIAFSSGAYQPKPVGDRFGLNGERLAGPDVTFDDRPTMVLLKIVKRGAASNTPGIQ